MILSKSAVPDSKNLKFIKNQGVRVLLSQLEIKTLLSKLFADILF